MKKITTSNKPAHHIAVFQETTIRRVWHNEEWWFSVVDVCAILTGSPDAGAYWRKLKQRLNAEGGQPVTFCHGLKLTASDGKQRETDCANTEGLFRIIQSIPSPKAEPFKRLRSISVRGELTDEWKARGVAEGKEYSILTAEIARATFGMTPVEHSQLKGLDVVKTGNNLRDHMTDLELIFTMLGEASTTEIARRSDALGFDENRTSAKEGGKIAGNARKALEEKTGKKVVSKANNLAAPTTPDLLADIAVAQPAKPKARIRTKPPKGRAT